jgi:hypothetical protein
MQPAELIFIRGGAPTAHEVCYEKGYKNKCNDVAEPGFGIFEHGCLSRFRISVSPAQSITG